MIRSGEISFIIIFGVCLAWLDASSLHSFAVGPSTLNVGPVSYTHLTLPTRDLV